MRVLVVQADENARALQRDLLASAQLTVASASSGAEALEKVRLEPPDLVVLGRSLPEGSQVTLGLFLVVDGVEEERVPPLWVKGRVAWCGETDAGRHTAGVRFEVITDAQKDWVRQVTGHLA